MQITPNSNWRNIFTGEIVRVIRVSFGMVSYEKNTRKTFKKPILQFTTTYEKIRTSLPEAAFH
jgi:hypothetical protein